MLVDDERKGRRPKEIRRKIWKENGGRSATRSNSKQQSWQDGKEDRRREVYDRADGGDSRRSRIVCATRDVETDLRSRGMVGEKRCR